MYMTFHYQQKCVYGFPSLHLVTRASADLSKWFLSKSGKKFILIVFIFLHQLYQVTWKAFLQTRNPLINRYGMVHLALP